LFAIVKITIKVEASVLGVFPCSQLTSLAHNYLPFFAIVFCTGTVKATVKVEVAIVFGTGVDAKLLSRLLSRSRPVFSRCSLVHN
jgi:hypothetical protein